MGKKIDNTYHIKVCDLSHVEEENNAVLNFLYEKLNENCIHPTCLEGFNEDEKEKILYKPYESFLNDAKWTTGRYVGEISLRLTNGEKKQLNLTEDCIRFTVKPRLGNNFLIYMLENVCNFKIPKSDLQQKIGKEHLDFYTCILLMVWYSKLAKADKYGMPRKTIKRVCQGGMIKGHLNVEKSIVPLNVREEVVSEYYEKSIDDTIGLIVYKAYDILDKLHHVKPSQRSQETINIICQKFQGKRFNVTLQQYKNIRYNSIYASWKPLVDYSWQIIQNHGVDPYNMQEEDSFALFFDMAEIWELYIGVVVSDLFKHCTTTNSKFSLFEEFTQRIIPDYITKDYIDEPDTKGARAVGDAKYMRLQNKDHLNNEQSYSVYYKTIMYMLRFKARDGFIFYPLESSEEESYQIKGYSVKNTSSKIIFAGLYVPEVKTEQEEEYDKYRGLIKKSEEAFVNKLKSDFFE